MLFKKIWQLMSLNFIPKMYRNYAISLIILVGVFLSVHVTCEDYANNTEKIFKLLSRRKRYLLFPEGSSFQLVFCVQTAALITIGDIFLYGNTAALAWSIPSDPKLFYKLKINKETLRRGDIVNTIYYVDADGKVIKRVPYESKQKFTPVFVRRSVDDDSQSKLFDAKLHRSEMHVGQHSRAYLRKDHMDADTKAFHRSSRVDLFRKMEKLLDALKRDGRTCVLYRLCKAAQPQVEQESFRDEFTRVLFTLPSGTRSELEERKDYEDAYTTSADCELLYPGCKDFEVPVEL
ncbi:hypothetical protein ACJJTC_017028 [Scirpophaga incertulas]